MQGNSYLAFSFNYLVKFVISVHVMNIVYRQKNAPLLHNTVILIANANSLIRQVV